jgi:hypothetical protein
VGNSSYPNQVARVIQYDVGMEDTQKDGIITVTTKVLMK